MIAPSFLGTPRPLDLRPASPMPLEMAAAGGAGSASLDFHMEPQIQDNWCWAATSTSVSKFFDDTSPWTQCGVATRGLAGQCCTDPEPCDRTWYLDRALTVTGNLRAPIMTGPLGRDEIHRELAAGNPVCCRIGWAGGGGHFVAVCGFIEDTDDVEVRDPLYGSTTIPLTEFLTSYRQSGSWSHTYLTKG